MNCTVRILVYSIICCQYAFANDQQIDSLQKVIKTSSADTSKARAYLALGESVYLSKPSEATAYWEKSLELANQIASSEEIIVNTMGRIKAASLNNLAFLLKKEGNTRKALSYLDECIEIENQLKNTIGLIEPYNLKASIFEEQGKINEALNFYQKSLKIAETHKLAEKQVMVLNNIGYLHNHQGNTEKALQYYESALAIVRKENNKYFTAVILNNIGKIYNNKGLSNRALPYYRESAAILEETNNPAPLSVALNNIGKIYHKKGQTAEALEHFKKALSISERLNNKEAIAGSLNNIAGVMTERNDLREAEVLYRRSLEMSEGSGWLLGQRNALEGLKVVYEKAGEFRKAYETSNRLISIKDSSLNLANSKVIAEMETKYQAEKKQLEIDNLEKERSLKDAELAKKTEEVKRQNIQKIAFGGGLALTALLSLFIYRSYREKKNAHEIISQQKAIVEEKNKDITDSITYAKRLQEAILPPIKLFKEYLPDSFILYKPKDIVAGDFYWMEVISVGTKELICFAAADCTGHGVPGAMVSVVCSNALNRAVKEFRLSDPGKVLDKVKELVIATFERSESEVKDGMDISLCIWEKQNNSLYWAGANNPLWIIRNKELKEIKADKQPIGKYSESKEFTTHQVKLERGDQVYLFTDGYADQFGGEAGKKFKYSKLKQAIVASSELPMEKQGIELELIYNIWRGQLDQVDDVCVIGVRV